MATYRGLDGHLSLGGVVSTGSVFTKGTRAAGSSSHTFDGNGATLRGVILAGDTFTVAGQATVHTIVTAGVIGASVANEVAVTFTPVVPAGNWADNAAVTFTNNRMAEVTGFEAQIERDELEDSELGDAGKTYKVGQYGGSGTATAWFDYGDAEQAEAADAVLATTPTAMGLVLVTGTDKQIHGSAVSTSLANSVQKGSLVGVTFGFRFSGAVAINWT